MRYRSPHPFASFPAEYFDRENFRLPHLPYSIRTHQLCAGLPLNTSEASVVDLDLHKHSHLALQPVKAVLAS
jgi:hypothetical protein